MKTLRRTSILLLLSPLFFGACSEDAPMPHTTIAVPATCESAFHGGGSARARSTGSAAEVPPTPVALSSCMKSASKGIEIGGVGGCGPRVVVDKDFVGANGLGKITIHSDGQLVYPDLADPDLGTPTTLDMETTGIEVQSGGSFSVGTAACPIGYHPKAHVTITFTGDRDPNCNPITGCDDGSVKGIEVKSGGSFKMYGAKGVPNPADPAAGAGSVSWTVLSETAGADGTRLHLAKDVTVGQRPWEAGDWITVGTSSFSPFETEFVQIKGAPRADGQGGSFVDLEQKLVYSHFGSQPPTPSQECTVDGQLERVACGSVGGCTSACESVPSPLNYGDPKERNFGVDERAEVGLISRSITLTAELPAPPPDDMPLKSDPNLHWGGEIRVAGGDAGVATFDLVGVEIEKFGKDQLGSYPVHVHMIGDAGNAPKIRANSVHHSFNKCMTVHMSSNLTYEDNVCARIVGHIFYEEHGSEENIAFHRNLGLGAMSNSFDIYKVELVAPNSGQLKRSELIDRYWWAGDNLARSSGYNYDGFNIPNTDDQKNPTRGSCQVPLDNGGFGLSQAPFSPPHPERCSATELYTEPASGFWLTNPTTELIGNAIGGCQGVGRGVWWVTPPNPIEVNGVMKDLKFSPLGIPGHPKAFFDNRAHACYGGFYGEEEYSVHSTVLVPHKGGVNNGQPLIARMEGMTATHNRFRGVWLRPTWFVVEDGRFATNRENVSLVTSGGIDGNAPGVWALLEGSVMVGVSNNNVDRWGPCPTDNELGINTGGSFGCIDHTSARLAGQTVHSADEVGLGYPPPSWNMFGYMLYDGPVRVFRNRFVNFKHDVSSLLTEKDNAFLATFGSRNTPTAQVCVAGDFLNTQCSTPAQCCAEGQSCPATACPLPNVLCGDLVTAHCCATSAGCNTHFVYEGDAALGWFQSNQSSYPTGTVTRELSFENTDLRHQIYTDKVSVNLEFNDGDKNTAVIDEDGTLTGYGVGDPAKGYENPGRIQPISLNNLPFNATSNSVDECFSRGAQNSAFEGRDSSLISANSMGTLEFSTLYPWKAANDEVPPTPIPFPGPDGDVTHTQFITFKRDDPERDANGDVRKDMNGKPIHSSMQLHSRDGRGIWEPKVTSGFGYTAAAAPAPKKKFPASTEKAGIAHIIDVGVADVVKPDITADNPFFIRLGICYTDENGGHPQDPGKFQITRGYKSYTGGFVDPTDPELLKYWTPGECENLDSLKTSNITRPNCPAPRERTIAKPEGGCPSGSTPKGETECSFPTDVLELVGSTTEMSNNDGTPNLRKYTYDKNTGMLFFWVAQDEPNPVGPSPLGSCTGNAATDDPACPNVAHGETYYACPVKGCHIYLVELDDPTYTPGPSNCEPYETHTHEPFKKPLELVLYGTKTPIQRVYGIDKAGDPFHTATEATDPKCKLTTAIAASTIESGSASRASSTEETTEGAITGGDAIPPPTGVDEKGTGAADASSVETSGASAAVGHLGTSPSRSAGHGTSGDGARSVLLIATATATPNGEPTPTSTPAPIPMRR